MSGLPGNPVTQSDGWSTATVAHGWSGTITPTLAGYTFTPASRTYADVTVNLTDNCTGALQQFTISGYVTASGGAAVAGVTLSGLPDSPVTLADGWYTDTVSYGWSGTVTPTLAGYTFTPTSNTYSSVAANQTNSYTAAQVFTVSGSVADSSGAPIAGVAMNGLPGNPATQSDGSYTATVSPTWSGTVTPTLAGYTFVPHLEYLCEPDREPDGLLHGDRLDVHHSRDRENRGRGGGPRRHDERPAGQPGHAVGRLLHGHGDLRLVGNGRADLAGYTFAPASKAYANVTANGTLNYTATQLVPVLNVQWSGALDFGSVTLGSSTPISGNSVTNTGGGTLKVTVSGLPPSTS